MGPDAMILVFWMWSYCIRAHLNNLILICSPLLSLDPPQKSHILRYWGLVLVITESIFPKLISWNLYLIVIIFWYGAFGKWWGHEGGALKKWINSTGNPAEISCSFCHVRTQQKEVHLWIMTWTLTGHQIWWHLDLGVIAFRTLRDNVFLSLFLYSTQFI